MLPPGPSQLLDDSLWFQDHLQMALISWDWCGGVVLLWCRGVVVRWCGVLLCCCGVVVVIVVMVVVVSTGFVAVLFVSI